MTALEILTKGSIKSHTPPNNQTSRANTGMPMNERITEGIVRDILKSNQKNYPKTIIDEQQSTNPRIRKLLQPASKSGLGRGSPEFIITFEEVPDLVIVIECKADVKKHESENKDRPKDYAVDGVLLYSEYLAKEFDVIAIAVSGQKESELKISNFLQLKSQKVEDKPDNKILEFEDYVSLYKKDPVKEKQAMGNLIKYSRELNDKLRDDFELEEGQRPLLVSGILIALEDSAFRSSYSKETKAIDLAKSLTKTIEKILEHHNIAQQKKVDMITVYKFIETNNNIARDMNEQRNIKLRDLITEIDSSVRGFMSDYKFHDILGQFYREFLRYANGDRGLGVVLTPEYLTELFVDIAEVNKDSVVLDNCCGTGGFLISAMKKMIYDVGADGEKIQNINNNQLIGIDNNSKMFCLACSNMLLRGDGKSNIYHNTCFDIDNTNIQKLKPTVGFLNPPYSKKKKGSEELSYVLNCLSFLEKNALCVAVVPMSCATEKTVLKERLLENHTLKAVMSLPNELFHPIGTVTCIMVFQAHVPHNKNLETWFGYWKDDGFINVKNEGRVDNNNAYDEIRKVWLDDYVNKKSIRERCVTKKVSYDDEWCAEAYMKTDYSTITKDDFIKEVRNYALFKLANGV